MKPRLCRAVAMAVGKEGPAQAGAGPRRLELRANLRWCGGAVLLTIIASPCKHEGMGPARYIDGHVERAIAICTHEGDSRRGQSSRL